MGADEVPGSPLPVKLISFEAFALGNNIVLNWKTAGELNSKSFEIERSAERNLWQVAGTVKAAGSSQAILSYALVDEGAFEKSGSSILYYRLKQIDRDGKNMWSPEVKVSKTNSSAADISIFPNPFTHELHLAFQSAEPGTAIVVVYDLNGRSVKTLSIEVLKGDNNLPVSALSSLDAGIYFLRLNINNDLRLIKLIKQ